MQASLADADLDVMLVVPLEPSERWDDPHRSLDELTEVPWVYGPGQPVLGLYVVRSRLWREVEQAEEHKQPLATPQALVRCVAYYRAWRRNKSEEFDRAIYLRSLSP